MTGFLARVAARAVSQAAPARPRLLALFEMRAPGGLETVDVETAAPRVAAGPVELAPPPDPAARRPDPAGEARTAEAEVPGTRVAVRAAPAEKRQREPEPSNASNNLLLEGSGDDGPGAVPAAEPGTRAAVAAAAPLAEATPSAEASIARATPAPESRRVAAPVPPARDEAPSVRVHIGRLEVRAMLPEPAAQPARRETARPPELSLSEYLRGRRAAR